MLDLRKLWVELSWISQGQLFTLRKKCTFRGLIQKWNLQKSACDGGVEIELRPVLAQFGAKVSFENLFFEMLQFEDGQIMFNGFTSSQKFPTHCNI